ncbi:phytanoyl-CoA dioxygenase family protein [Candidatus Pelagibacter sp. Uisw_113]|uniref:phytanoyl-CoA dioxygenase family protein n=1 Tax=Candidatus Pelagibacter sp. Uisw_113 TaxID=3230994 RepID=UPI0039ECEA5A
MSFLLKEKFEKNGYIILKTDFSHNENFKKIIKNIYSDLTIELKNESIKKFSGYIMGNLNVYPGKYGQEILDFIRNQKQINEIEAILGTKLEEFSIKYGGNLSLPNKGDQLYHTDGKYTQKMILLSLATEIIDENNGPTEVCSGSHKKNFKFWEFYFKKKIKKKLFLNLGDIAIRNHNCWHRGTKNFSKKPRLLLSLLLFPKIDKDNREDSLSEKLKIAPNFFKSNKYGRFYEYIYVKFGFIIVFFKLLFSIIKNK